MNLVQEIAWYVIVAAISSLLTIAIINQKSFIDEDEYDEKVSNGK
jgi:hypothetical protein